MTADIDGEVVLFLIGMRINVFWKIHKWLPVFAAMPRMIWELTDQRKSGLLGYRTRWGGRNFELIQYWSSFEELRDYARARDAKHLPAWADFNRNIGSDGTVGIWHETYLVKDDQFEAVYRNMPLFGMARATNAVPATGQRRTASGRLGRSGGEDSPVEESGKMESGY